MTLASIAFTTLTLAFQAGEKFSLTANEQHPNASGTAVIHDTSIQIDAKGLKPNSVYTAWFVNTQPKKHETGAGQPPCRFKTDATDSGLCAAFLGESPKKRV